MSLPYAYLAQSVATSLSISAKDDDSFFNPALGHTGFAYDGQHYTAGALDSGHAAASWFTEGASATRGPLAQFPMQVVVVIAKASISVLDATTDSLNLWMLFYLADTFAFPSNFTSEIASFVPISASWAGGKLTVVMQATAGTPTFSKAALTIDFTADSAYVDYSLAP